QSFWAVWHRQGGMLDSETLFARSRRVSVTPSQVTVRSGSARLELAVSPTGEAVEVVNRHGRGEIWTRKVPVRVHGHYTDGMEVHAVTADGLLDESAGYHARHTEWYWSAGVGTDIDGHPVTWNLVRGLHDGAEGSERAVWVHGRPAEVPPVVFGDELDEIRGADGSV